MDRIGRDPCDEPGDRDLNYLDTPTIPVGMTIREYRRQRAAMTNARELTGLPRMRVKHVSWLLVVLRARP